MCQESSTRQFLRSTVLPCLAAAAAHPVELHHALRDIERVVIGQGDNPGRQLDALRALGRGGQEHLGRADHLPAARMVLAAPEFVIAELVELLDEIEVAAELQQRVLADGVMRREKRAETETRHEVSPSVAPWPDLFRPSTSYSVRSRRKTWTPATSPGA